jgi:hypothetical protein
MKREFFYDRQFRVWVGLVKDREGNQIGDAEYFPNKILAQKWQEEIPTYATSVGEVMYYGRDYSYFW